MTFKLVKSTAVDIIMLHVDTIYRACRGQTYATITAYLTFPVSLNKKILSDNSKFLSISYYLLGGNASPLCVNTVNCIDFYLLEPKWTNFLLNWLKWELECLNAKILVFIEIDSPTFILASLLNPDWNKTPITFNDKIRTRKEINFFLSFFLFSNEYKIHFALSYSLHQ